MRVIIEHAAVRGLAYFAETYLGRKTDDVASVTGGLPGETGCTAYWLFPGRGGKKFSSSEMQPELIIRKRSFPGGFQFRPGGVDDCLARQTFYFYRICTSHSSHLCLW